MGETYELRVNQWELFASSLVKLPRLFTFNTHLHDDYPALSSALFRVYNTHQLLFLSLFLLHTYLVGVGAIMKAFDYDSNPALHSAAVRVIELVSAISLAQFLMVFLFSEALFIEAVAIRVASEKSFIYWNNDHAAILKRFFRVYLRQKLRSITH